MAPKKSFFILMGILTTLGYDSKNQLLFDVASMHIEISKAAKFTEAATTHQTTEGLRIQLRKDKRPTPQTKPTAKVGELAVVVSDGCALVNSRKLSLQLIIASTSTTHESHKAKEFKTLRNLS